MEYGFIKVATASPKLRVADTEFNCDSIISEYKSAANLGAKLVVFPELCITGYTCGDLFKQETLIKSAESQLIKIINETSKIDAVIIVGLPCSIAGKLYNCAAVAANGKLLGLIPKTNIPNYNEFYEVRHFTAASENNYEVVIAGYDCTFGVNQIFECHELPEFTLAVEICEDLWVPVPPSAAHCGAGAYVIANLSASDEIIGKDEYRRELVKSQSARLICGYIYADTGEGESTTDLVFSGHSLICENGTVLAESKLFTNNRTITELDVKKLAYDRRCMNTYTMNEVGYKRNVFNLKLSETELTRSVPVHPFVPGNLLDRNSRCEAILSMQASGLKKRIDHTRCSSAVVGISGGLDSCLALLVTVCAMDALKRPRSDIQAVTMPCFGTTKRTRSNAEKLCIELGVKFSTVDITEAVKIHMRDVGQSEDIYDVTYENCQARERTQVLMDIANRTGGIVIGTGDLSELALGWATFNGDHMSMYGVNCSIPKTLVRHIVSYYADKVKHENAELSHVLYDILDTPVSPELLPAKNEEIAQKTEDIVGPYELHDFFLYYFVRFGFPPKKIYHLAIYAFRDLYNREIIKKWLRVFLRRFFMQQFKRSCIPDGPKVGSVTLSPRGDFRMPSDAIFALWLDEVDKL